jgi:serine/threonine-protein kinase
MIELPAPMMTELPANTWDGIRPPTWHDLPGSETQAVLAVGGEDWSGARPAEYPPPPEYPPRDYARPPEYMPQATSLDPGGGRRPPGATTGGSARRPARRRLGLLILAAAAALAVPIVLIVVASSRSHTNVPPATPSPSGTTKTTPPRLAVPTVGGKIQIGQTPSYIQVAPNGKFAYIANPGAGAITVLNTANNLVSGSIKIPQGPPQFVSFSPDSRTAYVSVYVTNSPVHLIAFVDTATGAVTATVPVDNFTPGPSTPSPDGRMLYVPNHNTAMSGANQNVVDVIDTVSKKLMGKIAVPANPHWVVFDKKGRFYTSDHMSSTVTVLNASTNGIMETIQVGETPHSEAISPDGSRLAVTSFDGNEVFLINTTTEKQIATIRVGKNPLNLAYSPDGRYLCTVNHQDGTVTVIDTSNYHVIGEIPTGKAPTSMALLPNGRQAYVTNEGDGTIEILNFAK